MTDGASPRLQPVLDHLNRDFEAALERWRAFLRIPSVSTDPAYNDKTREAGQWLVDQLREIGFTADLRDTPGHPMVVAHHPGPGGDSGAPHLLYYGHYDVQPPDPVELWDSGPFDPQIVDGPRGRRMVARGAVDDKGQLMTFVEAFRAWHAVHGTLPVAVTAFFEGEEETGSPSLIPFLKENARELKADVAVVSDTGSWDVDTPAITTQLRGMLYTEVTVTGPSHDLHSGLYGGVAPNPANALTRCWARCMTLTAGSRSPVSTTRWSIPTPGPCGSGTPWGSTRRRCWAASAYPRQAASRTGRCWSGCGPGPPPTSTASGAAIPAPARRR